MRRALHHWLCGLLVGFTLLLAAPAQAQENFGQAIAMIQDARLMLQKGQYKEAEATLLKSKAWFEQNNGPEDINVGTALSELGLAVKLQGRYQEAERIYNRALELRIKVHGPQHPAVADVLSNMGQLFAGLGRMREAIHATNAAVRIYAQKQDHYLVGGLMNLGRLLVVQARYVEAEHIYGQAMTLAERLYGPEHPFIAQCLTNVMTLYNDMGRTDEAEAIFARIQAIYAKATLDSPQARLMAQFTVGFQHAELGQYQEAVDILTGTVDLAREALGPEHPQTAQAIVGLATVLMLQESWKEAEDLLLGALRIQEKRLGPDHADVADTLDKLAGLAYVNDRFELAAKHGERALAIKIKRFGPDHPMVADMLSNMGHLCLAVGQIGAAQDAFEKAFEIYSTRSTSRNPGFAGALQGLSEVHQAGGDLERALKLSSIAARAEEDNLALGLTVGSERKKRATADRLVSSTRQIMALHLGAMPDDGQAAALALTSTLRRKGRVLDAMAESLTALRGRLAPGDANRLDALQDLRTQIATQSLAGPGPETLASWRARLTALEQTAAKAEADLMRRSKVFAAQSAPVTLDDIRQRLPDKGALVEFAIWQPRDRTPRRGPKDGIEPWGAERYAAYILKPDGALTWADLGPRDTLDAQIARFRAAILLCPAALSAQGPLPEACEDDAWNLEDVRAQAAGLYSALWAPFEGSLSGVDHIVLAPEGGLHALPFEALVDGSGSHLIERVSMSWVTTGRDLLRFDASPPAEGPPLVIADPDYDHKGAPDGALGQRRSQALGGVVWGRLPGTALEGDAVAARMVDARLWKTQDAQEARLKANTPPRVLHIATHGFFLEDQPEPMAGGRGFKKTESIDLVDGAKPVRLENPLLRSGLVMAGANTGGQGKEDGVLTALELSSVDLSGTQLAVLSACETGLGDARNGQGVYGLRRALVLAGAQSLVMSLWQVSDNATLHMMTGYYDKLAAGQGRAEALRTVRLDMLGAPATAHPYFWASFVAGGQWTPMQGVAFRTPPPELTDPAGPIGIDALEKMAIPPGQGGCACSQRPARAPGALGLWVLLGLVGIRGRRWVAGRRSRS